MDPLQQIQNKIIKLEEQLKETRKSRKKWQDKYDYAVKKIEKLESNTPNQKEIEYLRTENGRLLAELNTMKRNDKANEKLKQIQKIIKG